MTAPNPTYGCIGTWKLNWTRSGSSGSDSYSNLYQADDPYLVTQQKAGCPNFQAIFSTRTNQQIAIWLCSSSANFTLTSKVFTPEAACSSQAYDCINGNCIRTNVYNTAGLYASLTACQAVCGSTGNPCPTGYECKPTNYVAPCSAGSSCKPDNYVEPCPTGQECKPTNYVEPCPTGYSCASDDDAAALMNKICC
jgi:hypothetical protein